MKKISSVLLCACVMLTICVGLLTGCEPAKAARDVCFYALEVAEQPNRNTDLSDRGDGAPQAISLCLARNEHEFQQVVVSPTRDIKNMKMQISALKDASGNTLDAEVTLYRAHYVQYNGDGVYRPTALIPLFDGSDGAMATDTVDVTAGNNQAFYLEVYSSSDTKAGTYTGTVTYSYDDTSESVPVSVTVWDFDLPVTSSLKTYYGFWSTMVEDWYKAWHPDTEINLNEKCNEYRDFLRSYRLSPGENSFEYADAEEWAQELRREVDAGYLSLATVSFYYAEANVWSDEKCAELNMEKFEAAKKYDLLDNVCVYVVDEPYWQEAYDKANRIAKIIDLTGIDVPQLVTTHYQADKITDVDIWCPTEAYLTRDAVNEAHERGQKFWTYCLVDFSEENDTYDRYRMWTYEYLNVDGYLMWLTNLFRRFEINGAEKDSYYVDRNIWEEGATWGTDDGQAVYFYPCTADDGIVGRDMAIPTVDLFTDCTGLEDYEYFTLLRDRFTALDEEWGTNLDINDVMYAYYAPVLSGADRAVISDDVTLGNTIRAYAAADILSGVRALVTVDNETLITKDGKRVTVYAEVGATVTVNGQELTGENCGKYAKYSVLLSASFADITVNGVKMTRMLSAMRDYDYYEMADSALRDNAEALGLDYAAFEEELYDSMMASEYVLREGTAVKEFAAAYSACEVPVLYRTYDYVDPKDNLQSRTLRVWVPVGCTVNGMTLVGADGNADIYETVVKCTDMQTFVPLTLQYEGSEYTSRVMILQHVKSGVVLCDMTSDALKTAVDSMKGASLTEDGLTLSFSESGASVAKLAASGLTASDLSQYTTVRIVVENPTDTDEKGFSVTVGMGFSKSADTPSVPAHSEVTFDIDLTSVSKEKRNSLKYLTFVRNSEETEGTYIIKSITAFEAQ